MISKVKNLKISQLTIYIVGFLLFLSSLFTSLESPFRYIKYLIFPCIVAFLLFNKKMQVRKLLFHNFLLYTILVAINFVTSIISGHLSFRFFEEVLLLLLPIITALAIVGYRNIDISKMINIFFVFYILSFIIYQFEHLINLPKLLSSFIDALKYSIFPTESWLAFPLGVFTLYYVLEKDYKRFFIALFFFLLAFKRIAIASFILSYGCYAFFFLFLNVKFVKRKIISFFITLNVGLIAVLYFFINGFFTRLIEKKTGISVNWFSQGRFQIYNDVINHFLDKIWFGSSLGFTHLYLDRKYSDIAFLHSDILKILLELGIASFIIWFVYFLYININNSKSAIMFLFINILLLTDNVFIYFDTLFIVYLIFQKYENEA
jgi:hypothetical protein